jgi:hypothetical protein
VVVEAVHLGVSLSDQLYRGVGAFKFEFVSMNFRTWGTRAKSHVLDRPISRQLLDTKSLDLGAL